MKTIQKNIPLAGDIANHTDLRGAAFLDIETAGLSARTSPVYLIGCLIPQGNRAVFVQWLAESPEEEAQLLAESAGVLAGLRLITFNGDAFDLPFLAQRAGHHCLPQINRQVEPLDLYRLLRPCRELLNLPDMKQKTLEAFLGLPREDRLSGGELIPVWRRYTASRRDEDLALLLLHNEEDVLALPRLLPLLSYVSFQRGDFTVTEVLAREQTEETLTLTLRLDLTVPQPVLCAREGLRVYLRGDAARLTLPLFSGGLKYFLPNYREYYYLPKEDMAIHRSVAAYVEREFRQRATPQTAYLRREGVFVRVPSALGAPLHVFRESPDGLPWMQLADCPETPAFWEAVLRTFSSCSL